MRLLPASARAFTVSAHVCSKKRYEVTLKVARLKWKGAGMSRRTCQRVIRDAGLKWRRLKERPVLSEADRAERMGFAERLKGRRSAWWDRCVALDGKWFRLALNATHRALAARQAIRGCYRPNCAAASLQAHRVKRARKMKAKLGGSIGVVGALCGPQRRIFLHVVPAARWNGEAAVDFYVALASFLKKAYPRWGQRKWILMEDNDPGGLATRKARLAKKSLRMQSIGLPKRSPDLSPLDYAVWAAVESKMRDQEKSMRKTETKKDFAARLGRTMRGLDVEFLKNAMRGMRRRLHAVSSAKGGLFEV